MQPYCDAKEFDDYVQESRNEFVTNFWKQWPNAKERVVAENLLICFDQMRDRLKNLQSFPSSETDSGPHECPNCNWQCTCGDHPCSCCPDEKETDYIQLAKAHAAEVHNK